MNIGQIYHIASIVCYILSALGLILTVYLFFRYRIVDAYNVLSGRKLKQDMERLGHLSGSASESGAQAAADSPAGKQKKKAARKGKPPADTEVLPGMAAAGETESNDTAYDTEFDAPYETEYDTEYDAGALKPSDTEELDIVVTNATDTELL